MSTKGGGVYKVLEGMMFYKGLFVVVATLPKLKKKRYIVIQTNRVLKILCHKLRIFCGGKSEK